MHRTGTAANQPRPNTYREIAKFGLAELKRSKTPCPKWAFVLRKNHGARRNSPTFANRGCLRQGRRCCPLQRTRNGCARPSSGLEIAFRQELSISFQHRQTRNSQVASQLASRRDDLTCAQITAQYALAKLVTQLAMQRLSRAAVERHRIRDSSQWLSHNWSPRNAINWLLSRPDRFYHTCGYASA
jgi:hypothetical protein